MKYKSLSLVGLEILFVFYKTTSVSLQKYKWCSVLQNLKLLCIFRVMWKVQPNDIQKFVLSWSRSTSYISSEIQIGFSKTRSCVVSSEMES